MHMVGRPPFFNITYQRNLHSNKVFFNIWSACSYASGNNTLPVFSLWTTTCTNQSVDLNWSATFAKSELGIDIPGWALLDIPGNTTFDLQKAVVRASLVLLSKQKQKYLSNLFSCRPQTVVNAANRPPHYHRHRWCPPYSLIDIHLSTQQSWQSQMERRVCPSPSASSEIEIGGPEAFGRRVGDRATRVGTS